MSPDTPIRNALMEAFTAIRPDLDAVVERMAAAAPEEERNDYSPETTGQFLNAFEALMLEALEAAGDEKRRFILDTAVPALVAQGSTPSDLMRGHVAFFAVLAHRMLERVPAEQCANAEVWLSRFMGDYCAEVNAIAIQAERDSA